MLRSVHCLLSASLLALVLTNGLSAQTLAPLPTAEAVASPPQLRKLAVPATHARNIATTLSLRYRDIPGVRISPDAKNEQLVVMAPQKAHAQIADDVQKLVNRGRVMMASSQNRGPMTHVLNHITTAQFESSLRAIAGDQVPVTTSGNGKLASFRLASENLQGTIIDVDREKQSVTVKAPGTILVGWQTLITSLDQQPKRMGDVTDLTSMQNAELAPIQRAIRLLKQLRTGGGQAIPQRGANGEGPFRNAVFQVPGGQGQGQPAPAEADQAAPADGDAEGEGSGVIGDIDIRYVPELDQIIIKGSKRDVARVRDIIDQIKQNAEETQPEVELLTLQHADCNAVAALLAQLYEDYLSARQGTVSITSLDTPNALLLIGRAEAIKALKELIAKIDVPIEATNRLRVFRLQFASAIDAETTIRDFFTERPGSEDENRGGTGLRVRVVGDYRTNSLVVNASPRDMLEVTRMINELDVESTPAQNEIKIFPLKNASAEDLAPTLQAAMTGLNEDANEDGNLNRPATSLSIVAVDAQGNRVVNSGVLQTATVTADSGANAIVVRAPSASMPLIAELIRQLDKAPGIDSLVKVFTIQNGDATQLTTALNSLFGDEAATTGTQIGAGNLAGLPSATASGESSLVPLRFTTDIRTNSIVASGSAEDLEVVESILLRLDSEGFAERITEVIWLRHNDAENIANAITDYVSGRLQSQTNIQQLQQGLGPFDMPERDIVAIPEIASNSILLSVSPRIYEEVRRLIDQLDRRRPMVMIKVLIAEVSLDDTFEIGGEAGLQDSLVFNRGLAVGQVPGALAPSASGFNFNNAGVPNVNRVARETLAGAAASTFGVGTTNPGVGYGGFVLNAASDSVSLLLRTLQDANRLQVLSRPQIMTSDNTLAEVNVGRRIARVTGVINNINNSQVVTEDVDVGLILNVRPRVSPDGLILMEVNATRSDRDPGNGTIVPTGDGGTVFIDDILDTTAQSVLTAYSGQTVVFGGLIQKSRSNFSRKVPIIGDIPILGHMFKYDQEAETRSELLIVMTPMLISGDQDLEYVKQVESSRMSWCLADVVEAHGSVGLNGGYGLWGPAVGNTIYPDVNPTVERERVISDEPVYGHGDSTTYQSTDLNAPGYSAGTPVQSPAPQYAQPVEPASVLPPPATELPAPVTMPAPAVQSLPGPPTAGLPAPAPVIEALPPAVTPQSSNGGLIRGQLPRMDLPTLPTEEFTMPKSLPASFEVPAPSNPQDRTTWNRPASQVVPATFAGNQTPAQSASWVEAASKGQTTNAPAQRPTRLGSADANQTAPAISPSLWIR